jgi:DNA-binding NtrC family response regulator
MKKKRILVIDGDNANATKIQTHLQRQGFLVTATNNAEHGKAILRMSRIDLLILDPTLPETGSDFLNDLASDTVQHKPAVIMTSALLEPVEAAWENFLKELPRETRAMVQAYVPKAPQFDGLDTVVDLIFEASPSVTDKQTLQLGDYHHPPRKTD